MALLELESLCFAYEADAPWVLRDLSLRVDAGDCLAVLGENGSGKTTLFRVLNGLSFPQAGTYRFDGEAITAKALRNQRFAKRFHQRIGYLFQNPDVMLFNATVFDEVAFGPRQMGFDRATVETRTRDCLALLGIEALAEKAPYHLSGGQKKKAALAAVLSLDPEVLVLDEPLAGLDKASRAQLLELLRELREAGKTLLIATHDEDLIALTDRRLTLGEDN